MDPNNLPNNLPFLRSRVLGLRVCGLVHYDTLPYQNPQTSRLFGEKAGAWGFGCGGLTQNRIQRSPKTPKLLEGCLCL